MEGEGIQDLINMAKRGIHKVEVLKKKAFRTANTLINGATNYPRRVRDMIRKYGDQTVTHMVIGRTPVQSAITTAINLVSAGEFEKNKQRLGYDKLFHLFLKLTLGDNTQIILEKNEVINIAMWKERANTEYQTVPLGNPFTLKEILDRTRAKMGDRFFKYDSAVNNCQDFILNVLQANSIGTPNDYAFVKQNTEELFKNSEKTRGIARFFTDLGGKANAVLFGAGVHSDYVVQCVCFPVSYGVKEAKKWLKASGYKSPKVDETENQLRFRQIAPNTVKKQGFTEYKTKEIGDGIQLVLVYKNKISTESMPHLTKGSSEAKEYMAKMRQMKGGSVEGVPVDMKGGAIGDMVRTTGKMSKAKQLMLKQAIEKRAESAAESAGGMVGCGVVHHHHHYMEGGSFWNKLGDIAKSGLKAGLRAGLPLAGKALGGLAGAKLGGVAGAAAGSNYGGMAGQELANVATSGWGLGAGKGLFAGKGVKGAKKMKAIADGTEQGIGEGLFAGKGMKIPPNKLAVINPMTGKGVRKGRFPKGSQEAKDHMASLRAMRSK
jgi:hypothetical protein